MKLNYCGSSHTFAKENNPFNTKLWKSLPIVGVSQGSNIGPLLFIIYVNDSLNLLPHQFFMYDDDATSCLHNTTLKQEILDSCNYLRKIYGCSLGNCLQILTANNEMIVFHYTAVTCFFLKSQLLFSSSSVNISFLLT